jgi:hypothetical protein
LEQLRKLHCEVESAAVAAKLALDEDTRLDRIHKEQWKELVAYTGWTKKLEERKELMSTQEAQRLESKGKLKSACCALWTARAQLDKARKCWEDALHETTKLSSSDQQAFDFKNKDTDTGIMNEFRATRVASNLTTKVTVKKRQHQEKEVSPRELAGMESDAPVEKRSKWHGRPECKENDPPVRFDYS